MYPTICAIGPFHIYSYGLMLALAFFVCLKLLNREAKRQNISQDFIFNFSFIVFTGGVAGARIFYIVDNLDYYLRYPQEIIMLQNGGLSWFGGLILGSILGIWYIKRSRVSFYKIFDLFAPYIALGQAIGRIGCLFNGCCFGKESGFGLYFPVHNSSLIPTQLYSSLLLIFIYIILRFLQNNPHKAGQIFYAYLLLYSVKRFFIEFWRADNAIIFAGFTLFQIISIVIFIIAIIKLGPFPNNYLRRNKL